MAPRRFPWRSLAFALGYFFAGLFWNSPIISPALAAESSAAVIQVVVVEMEGVVEWQAAGATTWQKVQLNQAFQPGQWLRTGENSRMGIRIADSIIRKGPLTVVEIKAPPSQSAKPELDLKRGLLYLFGRDKRDPMRLRTPTAAGAIRGTELNLEVLPDGTTLLALFDGEVELTNASGSVTLRSGDLGRVEPGQSPQRTARLESDSIRVIQWCLYYPAVLDVAGLELSAEARARLQPVIESYEKGDPLGALTAWPVLSQAASIEEKIFRAALLLSVGEVKAAEALLPESHRLGDALRQLIAAVRFSEWHPARSSDAMSDKHSVTQLLASSYDRQSKGDLKSALALARRAVEQSPRFGYGWTRVAELEFSFGKTRAARAALDQALALAPRNAQARSLRGFVAAGELRLSEALRHFDEAIALDGALGNAWLGRGLVRIHEGDLSGGRADLQMAAALEPQRAVLRSYLGKAFSEELDFVQARKELDLARRVDALDPTAWFYSALLNRQWNRINEAIEDLEQSKARNDERSLFRSKLLLDQDQAVRGANLAGLYRDAGLDDVSVREASRSVNFDYANASAHLFLANSYDALRDPRQVNLRYETPWFSELLLANLLAPIGAGSLSQTISQQDYSRLFARDRPGFSSGTEYQSAGDWHQYASHFGTFGGSSYAGDVIYTRRQGQRPNEDVEQWTVYGKFKQQLTAQDQLLVFANYYQLESGDVRQVYDPASPSFFSSTLRFRERQEPNAFAGWHHEWAPGSHTLLLVGRLDDEIELTDPDAPFLTLALNRDDSIRRGLQPRAFHQTYESALEAWTAELQHLWQTEKHTLIAGSRWHAGETESRLNVFRSATAFPANLLGTNSVAELNAIDQFISADLERFSIYGYSHWQIFDAFQLISGLSYDRLVFPSNIDQAPISEGEREKDRVSPKVGFLWALAPNTWFRGAYTRSLGGLYYDASVRLEPAQVAGFIQAFRSLAPESEIGAAPGMMQETTALGFDHRFATRTYFSVEGEILKSEGDRRRGVFMSPDRIPGVVEPAFAATLTETLEFEERSLNVSVNQLLGERWSFGARYRISDAELTAQLPDVPVRALASAATQTRGTLQHAMLYVVHYVPCGFFAQADLNWFAQSNRGYAPDRPGDEFWQSNAWLGYRFRNRIAEVSLGVLNIGGQDYRLNPLNLHAELPRERTFAARLKLNL